MFNRMNANIVFKRLFSKMWNIFSQEECVFHKRECIFTEMGRHKHCPEFGQVAINSFGIHGVVSKIPGILYHHGSGLFSVLFET